MHSPLLLFNGAVPKKLLAPHAVTPETVAEEGKRRLVKWNKIRQPVEKLIIRLQETNTHAHSHTHRLYHTNHSLEQKILILIV